MSTAATVPIFDPQGVLRDVPYEQMTAALSAGGKPAVSFQDPQGKQRYVPADRTQDAVKAGGKLLPIEQQDIQHPGLWAELTSDLKSLAASPESFTGAGVAYHQAKNAYETLRGAFSEGEKVKKPGDVGYDIAKHAAGSVGVNVPGMEKSAAEGDEMGVWGHALAVPTVMAATAAAAHGIPAGIDVAGPAINKVSPYVAPVADAVSKTVDVASFERASKIWNAWKDVPSEIKARLSAREPGVYPGASLPATPAPELLQGNALNEPGHAPTPQPSAALGAIPFRPIAPDLPAAFQPLAAKAPAVPGTVDAPFQMPARYSPPGAAGSMTESVTAPEEQVPSRSSVNLDTPRVLSGDSALRQVLAGQDNANLLKIARSRGISVTRESQLKPGVADTLLIDKIIDDFSDDELEGFRRTHIETEATRANMREAHPGIYSKVGSEANKTLAMQTYFPDVKIPAATLRRTQSALSTATAPPDNLSLLKDTVRKPKAKSTAAPVRTKSDVVADDPAAEDLLPKLQQMLKDAQAKKAQANQ